MPAFTVNRGYPYSVPTDPADVPEALQALAEAVEADLQSIEGSLPSLVRPIARLRGTTPQSIVFPNTVRDLTFDQMDFNLGGAIPALNPDNPIIVPQLPGFWFAIGSMTYQSAGSSTLSEIGVRILGGPFPGTTTPLGDQSTHVQPPTSDNVRNHAVATGQFCDGSTTVFKLRAYLTRASGTVSYQILDRSLTLFRMTQS